MASLMASRNMSVAARASSRAAPRLSAAARPSLRRGVAVRATCAAPLVGSQAPDFKATAVYDQEFVDVSLSKYKGKYVVLFFYPLDFTFVCEYPPHPQQPGVSIDCSSCPACSGTKPPSLWCSHRKPPAQHLSYTASFQFATSDMALSGILQERAVHLVSTQRTPLTLHTLSLTHPPAHPTPPGPTEITAFSDRHAEFKKLNTEVLGVSVDSQFTHLAWIQTDRKEGGLGDLAYPLVADLKKEISEAYGVLTPDGIALRGLFIIDKEGVVQHATINNLAFGRSVDETLRTLQAIQYVQSNPDEVCPAGWKPGDKTMKPDPKGSKEYFAAI